MKKSVIGIGIVVALAATAYTSYHTVFAAPAVTVSAQTLDTKFAQYSHPESFISAQKLKVLMDDPNQDVVVIGALNPIKPDAPIAGSFSLWRDDYSTTDDSYPFDGMRNSTADMEQLLSQFGATETSTIVVYAATSHHDAARLYWQLQNIGHHDVRYLDGGLNAWLGADLPTSHDAPRVTPTQYKAKHIPEERQTLATLPMVLDAQNNPEWVIIDTRGREEFNGETTLGGAFGPGTIPSSVHINWTRALNEDSTLKTAAELRALYGDIIKGKQVIAYCQSGVRSAHTTLILEKVLGAKNVYNYDGSWIEYSYAHYQEKQANVAVINGQS